MYMLNFDIANINWKIYLLLCIEFKTMDQLNIKTPKQNVLLSKKITCKGTFRQVLLRVHRLKIQSVMLVFST